MPDTGDMIAHVVTQYYGVISIVLHILTSNFMHVTILTVLTRRVKWNSGYIGTRADDDNELKL